MNRENYYVAITWREDEASSEVLESSDFEGFKRSMIDEGFENIQTEWYEKGSNQLPDRYIVFIYWEYPDTAPAFKNIKKWALRAIQK
jgi:hypothetical protein